MRMFGETDESKIRVLNAYDTDWFLQFDAVERAAESDRIARMWGG